MSKKDADLAVGVENETRVDQEISLDELLEGNTHEGPIKLINKNDEDSVDADARNDKAPPLPKKENSGVHQKIVLGEDMRKKLYDSNSGDQEISIHDILDPASQTPHQPSDSVKAFFGSDEDVVDATREGAPSFAYNMNHKSRGWFIILNHMKFQKHLRMNKRDGTHRDRDNLKKTAKKLGFDLVRSFDDLTLREIKQLVDDLADHDHSEYDCFVMAVLTHGDEGDMLYAHDATYHVDQITEPFMANRCESLAGKPKLFFFQACRGTKLDEGMGLDITPVAKHEREVIVIPNAADFLLAYSTVPGYYAWRNQSDGSWFIQALCKCLNAFGDKLELMHIMTRVNRMVAYEFISNSKQNKYFDGKKQIPSIVTRLTSEVYFKSEKAAKLLLPSGRGQNETSRQIVASTDGSKTQEAETSYEEVTGQLRETNL